LEKDAISYLYLSMILIGIVISMIFTYYNFQKGYFGKLISIQLILSAYGIGVATLTANDLMAYFPHTFRTGMLILYIIPALIYLALSKGILKEPFKLLDIIHLLPATLYIVNFLPSFTASTQEKIILINQLKTSYFKEGILFKQSGVNLLIIIVLILYMIKIYLDFFQFGKKPINPYHKTTAKIFISYLGIQLMIPIWNQMGYFDGVNREKVIFYVITTIVLYATLLLRPKFIYGITTVSEQNATLSDSGFVDKPPKLTTNGSHNIPPLYAQLSKRHDDHDKFISEDLKRIENYLNNSLDFLKTDFSQKMMEKATLFSNYKIRTILKNEKDCSFPEYINKKRIEYLLKKLDNDPKWRLYDSITLANESGYKSVNTFYIAFKKVTDTTPKNYIDQIYGPEVSSP